MATNIRSQKEFYDLFINAMQTACPALTDTSDGSILDGTAGVVSYGASEIANLAVQLFKKTFFNTANGPKVTGGDDDIQTLAVDHFGSTFERPIAIAAQVTVTFSRPTTGAGSILIPAGTIVKTKPDSNGNAQRFATQSSVTLVGTSISASATAVVAGQAGNALANTIIVIESTLLDSTITVTNGSGATGGSDEYDDAQYLDYIRNKIEAIKGAVIAAIEAVALNVSGIETATLVENEITVIQYDIASNAILAGAKYFRIPQTILYIADVNGSADSTLIANTLAALETVQACGVLIDVQAATGISINWTAALALNPLGPNYSTLSSDTTKVKDSMRQYINGLPIGTSFSRATADAALLTIWGPSGTNDLTSFATTIPAADVTVSGSQKFIAGTIGTA